MSAYIGLKRYCRVVCKRAFGGRRIAWAVLSLAVIVALLVPLGIAQAKCPPVKLIIDTDPGVDDAAALAWLFSQNRYPVDVLGIVSVVGNTEAMLGAVNTLMLLDVLERDDVPVVMGAATPMDQPNSLGSMLVHGPDGLWGFGAMSLTEEELLAYLGRLAPTTAPAFYCEQVAANPGATVLTLGPLTNVAQAVQECPETMAEIDQIVAMGGSRMANAPQTDYNAWQDPEAAEIVLSSGIPLTLVLLESSAEFTLDEDNLQDLMEEGNPAAQFIAGPMQVYALMHSQFGEATQVPYYDVAAAMYAMRPSLGTSESALVRMVTEPSLSRGQTVVGLTFIDRVSMLIPLEELNDLIITYGDQPDVLFGILYETVMDNPDNGQVVLDVKERRMRRRFMRDMTR